MNGIDLHIHSSNSDGVLTPAEIVELAAKKALCGLSLTDHDTTAGTEQMQALCAQQSIDFIPGVEISANLENDQMHILGYGFDPKNSSLRELLEGLLASRHQRNLGIIGKLNALGINITLEEASRQAKGPLGRPHFAALLLAMNKVRSEHEAFASYLRRGGLAYVERLRPDAVTAIRTIHKAGGIAVVAHPGSMGFSFKNLKPILKILQKQGLDGIEVFHPMHTKNMIKQLRNYAEEQHLLVTGGSDFHGRVRDKAPLGEYGTGKIIHYRLLQILQNTLQKNGHGNHTHR